MRAFSDHHRYTQDEMRALERAAQEAGAAALLCTEKDTFNFPQVLPPLNIPLFYCRIRLQPADPDGLLRAIHAVAARRRGGPR